MDSPYEGGRRIRETYNERVPNQTLITGDRKIEQISLNIGCVLKLVDNCRRLNSHRTRCVMEVRVLLHPLMGRKENALLALERVKQFESALPAKYN